MNMKKRLLSIALCLALALAMLPAGTIPVADAAVGATLGGFAFNQLASRAMSGMAVAVAAIGEANEDPRTAALVNQWVFGIYDESLEAIARLEARMEDLHEEVMAELDLINEKLDKNLSGIEAALGTAATNDAYDNYMDAWYDDVSIPMALNGYNQVVNAYKIYLEYAGSYKTGTKVSYGGTEMVATGDMVQTCYDSYRAALITMTEQAYDATSGMTQQEYYDHILYETNIVDLKIQSTVNNLLGRMLNATGAPVGGRYIDRAAQVAFSYFPFSENQAAFVDAAVRKQSYEITMALLAYQEFIGMRLAYCDAKYEALEQSGASAEELAALQTEINNCCAPNDNILQLIGGGAACTFPGGVVTSVNSWLSEPLYISNADKSFVYLQDYLRATDTDSFTLINTEYSSQTDPYTLIEESESGSISEVVWMTYSTDLYDVNHLASTAQVTSEQMQFVRRGIVIPTENGRAVVKPIYLLSDETADRSAMLMSGLTHSNEHADSAAAVIPFVIPNADYYNFRDGRYTDGQNTYTQVNGSSLKAMVDNNVLSLNGGLLSDYFRSVIGTYPEGRDLVVLSSAPTKSDGKDTIFRGISMNTTADFTDADISASQRDDTSYIVALAGSDVSYGKLTVESDGLDISLSGEGYDSGSGRTAAASVLTLTITPNDCRKIGRITAQYHEDLTDPSKVTHTQVVVDESTVDLLSYGEDGSVNLVYYMPYANVTLVVESAAGHTYSDTGFCPICGAYEPAVQGSNSHLISNAGQLYWFSAAVRGDMTHISEADLPELETGQLMSALYGTITAPIDLSVANDPWVPIGTSDTPYRGQFDGGNQPITNLNGMLFGHANSVSLQNIAIESGSFGPDDDADYAGSIVGSLNGHSTMTHCYSKAIGSGSLSYGAGGLVGNFSNGTMGDCYYAGSLRSISNGYIGGLVGACGDLTIENCSVSAEVGQTKAGGLVGDAFYLTIQNSYYDSGWAYNISACYSNKALAADAARSSDAYEGGEVAYLLNAERENAVWYQTIGEQDYPEFTGKQVYHNEEDGSYYNEPDVTPEEPEFEKFDIAGVNMTLGNELELNIMLPKDTVDAYGVELTATVTHHEYVNGDTEYVFAVSELPEYSSGMYYKASVRVAAAQMTDLIDIVVTDADGKVYNNDFTTSVRTYVDDNIDKQTDLVKTLLVDMANYGAAAQDHFVYHLEEYANANLTETHQTLATPEVECTDIREQGTNYAGSNLSLEDRILLNFMFNAVSDEIRETMYATVEFTGVLGNEVKETVPVEVMLGEYIGVSVDQIVLADSVCPVTVTLYNEDGTVYGSATDSVESYNARQNPDGTNALYSNIMKFAASAYAYKQG